MPDEKNCLDPKPEESIKIGEVIIPLARLTDTLGSAAMLQIFGCKAAIRVMLPDKKRIESVGIMIIIINKNSLFMSD